MLTPFEDLQHWLLYNRSVRVTSSFLIPLSRHRIFFTICTKLLGQPRFAGLFFSRLFARSFSCVLVAPETLFFFIIVICQRVQRVYTISKKYCLPNVRIISLRNKKSSLIDESTMRVSLDFFFVVIHDFFFREGWFRILRACSFFCFLLLLILTLYSVNLTHCIAFQ